MTGVLTFPGKAKPWGLIDPLKWQGKPIPRRRWLAPDLIPMNNVTMLAGDGGLGKSQIALQLLIACALGKPWLGVEVPHVKTLGVFCEDDEDELHRRMALILEHYGADFADLEDMALLSRVGLDNAMMQWENQYTAGDVTGFAGQVTNTATEFGAQLVVLDSLHDVFEGNENARPQARQFIASLRTIATETRGAVLLTAHPSLTGRSTGTGESGSTAWRNTVRSMVYLTKPEAADDEASADERVLKTMKANYGPMSGEIEIVWQDGLFVRRHGETGIFASIDNRKCVAALGGNLVERPKECRHEIGRAHV